MTSETDTVQCEQELETPVTAPEKETPKAEIPRLSAFALSSIDFAETTTVEIPALVQESPLTLAEAYAKLLGAFTGIVSPAKRSSPEVGVMMRASMRASTDLPDPLSPTTAVTRPALRLNETASTARTVFLGRMSPCPVCTTKWRDS